ncbi:hypothetical protein [Nonomuraea angiospora]|uniref:hypothetical protein n=1 Tax=Nonomuraea angiospora TaxID=46172 RepID=UPI00299FB0A0|nr:hypothetical protein [Nonomuraea angiospora]MDX3099980.1 hypothetical protein [Nonomuraea angiospora]
MRVTLSMLVLLAGPPTGDNGATRMGGNWVTYGIHWDAHPGGSARGASSGGNSAFSDCRSIAGPGQISYVQCAKGPVGQQNVFNAVTPGDPGAPAVTPEMLMQQALRLLTPPAPKIITAPPRSKNGYVGLRQFFWAKPGQWHAISKKATAGPVWAEVTATPTKLTVQPGAGQATFTCSGPGVPYNQAKSPDDQNIDCTHVFTQSSAGLPGSRYQVTVSMAWSARWTGSGGSGGTLAPIITSATFPLRVGEAPALVGKGS